EFRARALMRRMNVEIVCTTDDPVDSLEFHKELAGSGCHTKVYPTWRPDKLLAIDNPSNFNSYISKLEEVSDINILSYEELLEALQKRHDLFESHGCVLSDHGLDRFYAEPYTEQEIEAIFMKVRMGKMADSIETDKFRSAILYELAKMDARSGWAQQF
ncbi:glucuronate isomerase, partial [gut metagenome]